MIQDPIGSEVTREVAQIALLVWKVGKCPILYRFMSKVKQHEVLWIVGLRAEYPI